MFLLGSAYPTAKLGINASMPPILFGAIRMLIVFICLVPFLNFKLPNKKYLLPLFGFAFSMGVGVNLFLYLSVKASSIISPSAPFGGMKDSGYGKEAGIESIKDYTRVKTTWYYTSDKPTLDPFSMR